MSSFQSSLLVLLRDLTSLGKYSWGAERLEKEWRDWGEEGDAPINTRSTTKELKRLKDSSDYPTGWR
jgi:hypothetical protein